MRADRLVSLVLLLRQRGRMTADQLAGALEVSTRTVLRDIDALSVAGVPVYAERGRHGGFSLLPGFRTELTGLNDDEALALLTAGRGDGAFGLGGQFASAMRKVVDALPEAQRPSLDDAASRLLIEPERDLLSRRRVPEDLADGVMTEVRRAVLAGRRLRFRYAPSGEEPKVHAVDPVGLVTVRGRSYLLALKGDEDRTYRLSRMLSAEVLADPAQRPRQTDLERIWAERGAAFLSESRLAVTVRVRGDRRDELLDHARGVRSAEEENDGWVRLEVDFEDLRHAVWAVWQLDTGAEALAPESLRSALRGRAVAVAERYAEAIDPRKS